MLDIQLFRSNIVDIAQKLASRGFKLNTEYFTSLEKERYMLQIQLEKLKTSRNSISKEIGLNKLNNINLSSLIEKRKKDNELIMQLSKNLSIIRNKLHDLLLSIPNLPHQSVPIGSSESNNIEIRRVGQPKSFNFPVLDHVDIGIPLGLDIDTGVKLSGTRFMVLRGQIAQLHRALIQYMLDTHTNCHGYTEMYTPYIVNADMLLGTGQLPKFANDMFQLECKNNVAGENSKKYLISTSEITLINTINNTIINSTDLPIKLTAHSPCFRSEAGSYGRDTRGIIRQHQFDKVEIVQIVQPSQSYNALEEMVSHAEAILHGLNLPYRVVMLCTGDMSFSASKTYDLEVWLPAQNTYREISSCSNTESFQARRIKARYRNIQNKRHLELVHTLNGSGLAVGRTLVAILENFQNIDNTVTVPKVLRPYLGGLNILKS